MLNKKLYKYLIEKLNNLKNPEEQDIINNVLENFRNYLIEFDKTLQEDKELLELFKQKDIVSIYSLYQPIISSDSNKINKFEILTSFKINKELENKELKIKADNLINSFKGDLLRFISDYCYDGFTEKELKELPELKKELKELITNTLVLKKINDAFNVKVDKTIEKELKPNEKEKEIFKVNDNFKFTINIGKYQFNNNFANFLNNFVNNIEDNEELKKLLKEKIELELLEHPLPEYDKKLLSDKELLKKQEELKPMFETFDNFGIKIHMDDYNGNNMYNRLFNLTMILNDKLKSVKIDKELISTFNVTSLVNYAQNGKTEKDKKKRYKEILEILTKNKNNKQHYLVEFFEDLNLNKNNEDIFSNKEKLILDILNKNLLEIMKIYYYSSTRQLIDLRNNKKNYKKKKEKYREKLKKLMKEDFEEIMTDEKLLSPIEIFNYLDKKYKLPISKNPLEITNEYVENKETCNFINNLKYSCNNKIFQVNSQGYYYFPNIPLKKLKNFKFQKFNSNNIKNNNIEKKTKELDF